MVDLRPDSPNAKEWTNESLDIKEQLRRNRLLAGERDTAGRDRRFADDFENWRKQQAAIAENIEKDRERVKALGEQWKSVFDEAFARANSNNPFVSIYSDATAAVERFTQQTVGLNK